MRRKLSVCDLENDPRIKSQPGSSLFAKINAACEAGDISFTERDEFHSRRMTANHAAHDPLGSLGPRYSSVVCWHAPSQQGRHYFRVEVKKRRHCHSYSGVASKSLD